MTLERKYTILADKPNASVTLTPSRQVPGGKKQSGTLLRKASILKSAETPKRQSQPPAAGSRFQSENNSVGDDVQSTIEAEKLAKYQLEVQQIVENCQKKFSKDQTKGARKGKMKRLQSTDR